MSRPLTAPAPARPARVVVPAPRAAWEALLQGQADTPVESTPAWLDCVRASGRYVDASRLYTFADGKQLIVPLATTRLAGRLGATASWPYDWGFGGVVTGGNEFDPAQVREVLADLALGSAVRTRLAFPPTSDPVWAREAPRWFAGERRTVQTVDLAGGYAAVYARFRPQRRTAMRRAARLGVQIEVDRRGRRLREYDDLFAKSIARWAREQNEPLALCRFRNRRANPHSKVDAVARTLGERCAVRIAWVEGRPAAAIITLRSGRYETCWHTAMDVDLVNPTRAMDLLMASAISDACAAGCTTFDLGESRSGSPLARFKAGFGARERDVHLFTRERLPLASTEQFLRTGAKRVLDFRDR